MALSEWPGDDSHVTRWLQQYLHHSTSGVPSNSAVSVTGWEQLRTTVTLNDDTEVAEVIIDASQVNLRVNESKNRPGNKHPDATDTSNSQPAVVTRRPSMIRSLRLHARPVRIEDIAVTCDAAVHDLPIEWITYAAPQHADEEWSRYDIAGDDSAVPLATRATLAASIETADIGRLIARVMRPLLRKERIMLRTLSVTTRGALPGTFYAQIRMAARWKLLGASLTARVRVRGNDRGDVLLASISLRSINPLVVIALLFARPRLRELRGTRFSLNAELRKEAATPLLFVRSLRVRGGQKTTLHISLDANA
ncbi:hypothetical protein [Microbacterium sp. YY-01]|uniref:hypothetical protein n=1 Tax=Microbacterium sp. YY-01 TaxID=3421634 RepID=UPI003D16F6A0